MPLHSRTFSLGGVQSCLPWWPPASLTRDVSTVTETGRFARIMVAVLIFTFKPQTRSAFYSFISYLFVFLWHSAVPLVVGFWKFLERPTLKLLGNTVMWIGFRECISHGASGLNWIPWNQPLSAVPQGCPLRGLFPHWWSSISTEGFRPAPSSRGYPPVTSGLTGSVLCWGGHAELVEVWLRCHSWLQKHSCNAIVHHEPAKGGQAETDGGLGPSPLPPAQAATSLSTWFHPP